MFAIDVRVGAATRERELEHERAELHVRAQRRQSHDVGRDECRASGRTHHSLRTLPLQVHHQAALDTSPRVSV